MASHLFTIIIFFCLNLPAIAASVVTIWFLLRCVIARIVVDHGPLWVYHPVRFHCHDVVLLISNIMVIF